jgi:hypothetical protein
VVIIRLSKINEVQTQRHIRTIRDSQTYGVISSWAPNDKSVLTRIPMFGKSLPFNNDTSSSNKMVMCCYQMGLYLGHMNHGHKMLQKMQIRVKAYPIFH